VAELNEAGVLIDLSHTGRRSTLEAIEASAVPVAITHACVHALTPHVRNKRDDVILALAERGGVFGVNAVARLVSPYGLARGARLSDLLDHVDYLVQLVGIDHVGLGLDISEGMTAEDFAARRTSFLAEYPELGGDFAFEHYYTDGLSSMAGMPTITDGLVERGYTEDDVLKVVGGNFLRVFAEAWGPAATP
jgi:membrane dipeptidase